MPEEKLRFHNHDKLAHYAKEACDIEYQFPFGWGEINGTHNRTEISHTYSYRFKTSARSRKHKSGLDYTKIVILGKTAYLDSEDAMIDRDEYKETLKNIEKIKRKALGFVEDYMALINGMKRMHANEFLRRYSYSPLKYFHKEMGI